MAKEELRTLFEKKARAGEPGFAIAWALMDLADAQEATARAIQRLGNADASTHFGAIEALGMEVGKVAEALTSISSSVSDVGLALSKNDLDE